MDHYVSYLDYKVEAIAELGEINSVKYIYPVKREYLTVFLDPIFIPYFNDQMQILIFNNVHLHFLN